MPGGDGPEVAESFVFGMRCHADLRQAVLGRNQGGIPARLIGHGDAVTVLPYDPVRDRVLLVEQFRAGPYGRGDFLAEKSFYLSYKASPTHAPFRRDDLTQASTNATPSSPSFRPGNVTAPSSGVPWRRARIARAASA